MTFWGWIGWQKSYCVSFSHTFIASLSLSLFAVKPNVTHKCQAKLTTKCLWSRFVCPLWKLVSSNFQHSRTFVSSFSHLLHIATHIFTFYVLDHYSHIIFTTAWIWRLFDATFQMLSEKGFAWRSPLTTLQIVQVALLVVRKPRENFGDSFYDFTHYYVIWAKYAKVTMQLPQFRHFHKLGE